MDEFDAGEFDELMRFVRKAVRRLDSWLRQPQHVAGFGGVDAEDLRYYVEEIAYILIGRMPCRCRLGSNCPQQHNLAAQPASGLTPENFIHRAVIGPLGLRTNSIAQGMMFPFLREELGMCIVSVELKQCYNASCQRQYEGNTCVYCGAAFTPDTTKVVGVDWLVLEGVYVPVRRWRCGKKKDTHFYQQRSCREEVVGMFPDARYHVVHGAEHDRCPWQQCPDKNPPHPQRGTELWVRAEFAGAHAQGGHAPPRLLDGIAEGMRRALDRIRSELRDRVLAEFGDNPLSIAEGLFTEQQSLLTKPQLDQVRQAIRRALSEGGIDEETINDWLRAHDVEAEAEEVTQDERQDDNA